MPVEVGLGCNTHPDVLMLSTRSRQLPALLGNEADTVTKPLLDVMAV
jgi:hypothetical protein